MRTSKLFTHRPETGDLLGAFIKWLIEQRPSLVTQWVKNLPAMLGPLEEEMATHSSILAWETPWTEEPGRLQSMGLQELDTTE